MILHITARKIQIDRWKITATTTTRKVDHPHRKQCKAHNAIEKLNHWCGVKSAKLSKKSEQSKNPKN